MLFQDREAWGSRFQGRLEELLGVRERLAMPGTSERTVWVTGDATLTVIGAVDWTCKLILEEPVQNLYDEIFKFLREEQAEADEDGAWQLGGSPPSFQEPSSTCLTRAGASEEGPQGAESFVHVALQDGEAVDSTAGSSNAAVDATADSSARETDLIIALRELLVIIALAAAAGERWIGKLVLYIGDNSNVDGWLGKRQSSNRVANFLLLVLHGLEAFYGFATTGAYIRTYHNVTADDLARKSKETIGDIQRQHGLERVSARVTSGLLASESGRQCDNAFAACSADWCTVLFV